MHYLIFPKQDSWIWSKTPTFNYGLDEILEIRKDATQSLISPTASSNISRILIQFDTASFSSQAIASASSYFLNLYAANALELPSDYTINVFPITRSWTNGTGFPAASTQKTNGVSWTFKSEDIAWNNSGSDYDINIGASQSFSFNIPDIRVDVTNIVRAWVSGTTPNFGFIVKRSDAEEFSVTDDGRLTFYSMDTHTVNIPVLEAVWDDSIFITGSAQMIYQGNVTGYMNIGTVTGTFDSASGNTTAGGGTITASFLGSAIHFVTQSLSSSLSGSFNILTTGNFSGSFLGLLSGSISGSMNTPIVSSSLFIGIIDGIGTLSGSYSGSSLISGSIDGNIISTGSAHMFVSGDINIFISGTLSGSFIGTASANQYFFELVNISGSNDTSGSVTGSYTGTGIINFSNAVVNIQGRISSSFFPPGLIVSGNFTNVLAGTTFQPLVSDQLAIVMRNLKKDYKYATSTRIRLVGKDQYQRKTFANTAATNFAIIKYLPKDNTFYSIVDAATDRIIIPFSDFTKVSCDLDGNFFDLNLHGFVPQRFYRILFKVTMNGADSYFDNNYIFKVIR